MFAAWWQVRLRAVEDAVLARAGRGEGPSPDLPSLATLMRYRGRIERDARAASQQLWVLRRSRKELADPAGIGSEIGTWVPLVGLEVGASTPVGDPSTGAGGGKASAEPLTLSFGPEALGPALDQAVLSGQTLAQVEVDAWTVGDTPQLVDEYLFGTARASAYSNEGVDASTTQRITVAYRAYGHTHHSFGEDGSPTGSVVSGWDFATNLRVDVPDTPDRDPAQPSGIAGGQLHYFARFEGIASDHGEWVPLTAFQLGASALGSNPFGGGTSASPQALLVSFGPDAAGPALTQAMLSGAVVPQVQIEAWTTGEAPRVVDEYVLGGAIAIASSVSGDESVTSQQITLAYGTYGHVHHPLGADGSPAPETATGWNFALNEAAIVSAEPDLTPEGLIADGGEPLQYFGRFAGIGSDSGVWVPLGGFGLGATTPQGSGFGGAPAAGKAAPEPLHVSFAADSAGPGLDLAMLSGQTLTQVEVEAWTAGASPRLVEEYVFGDAVLASSSIVGDASTTTQEVSFAYRTYGHTHHTVNEDGSAGPEIVAGWDFALNEAADVPDTPNLPQEELSFASVMQPGQDGLATEGSLAGDQPADPFALAEFASSPPRPEDFVF